VTIPGRGTSRGRLLAKLAEVSRLVMLLPEPACALLEQTGAVDLVLRHVGTATNVTTAAAGILSPLLETVGAVRRAVNATKTSAPRSVVLQRRRRRA
jgi:hypothetical protein